MIVHISSVRTFHALDLARQMARLCYLGKLYTGLPSSMTSGLPEDKVCRQSLLLGPQYVARKLGLQRAQLLLDWPTNQWFDRWLATKVEPCDVFHCMSGMGLLAHRVARQRYDALTVCDHGSTHIIYQNNLLSTEYERWGLPYKGQDLRKIEKQLTEYTECDLITVPSSFAIRSFIEQGVPVEKLVKIPYGVDLSQFHPISKEDKIFRVLYVGQLSIRKGIFYILEALATLKIPNFELVLIGQLSSEVKPFLVKYANGFKYLGPKPRTELYRYYSQASIFVIASVEEGLALVQAQAMACGLPIIATTNTGAEDLFTDEVEGYIIPIRSPAAIREKVLFLYENPEVREQMSRAALRCVQKIGGWDEYGECTARTYIQALADRTKGENKR